MFFQPNSVSRLQAYQKAHQMNLPEMIYSLSIPYYLRQANYSEFQSQSELDY